MVASQLQQRILVLFLGLLLAYSGFAQSHKVSGTVVDADGNPLAYATAVLLTQGDSIMKGFGLTKPSGEFQVTGLKSGDYLLQVTFVGYAKMYQPITVHADLQLGNVTLEKENVNLAEFEVQDEHIPMKIKGDTVQYNANAFQTQPNAAVEDLLKQLPGVEVEKDGSVSAQGETVRKVLVDGKEFFGDDPKIATKNLPADAVDKVEVFDKMSDMSEFTGVDDGERTKTINLVLKEGKKAGYFGQVTGGYGYPNDRFAGKLSLNQFTKKTQLSVIGMANNINEQGFSIDDYASFMGGFRNLMESGLATFNNGAPSVSLSGSSNSGITTTYAGGLNFNYELSPKTKLTSNYFFNRMRNDLQSETTREYFNNTNLFGAEESTNELSESDNHRLNVRVDHEIDSTQDLRFQGRWSYNEGFSNTTFEQQSLNSENVLLNGNSTDNRGEGSAYNLQNNLMYRKRFGKRGRSLVANLNLTAADDNRDIDLNSVNSFWRDDSLGGFFSDTLEQRQDYANGNLNLGGELRYTEPLGKGRYLEFNYRHQENRTELDKQFFDIAAESGTESLNDQLSNRYDNLYRLDRAGVRLRQVREKYNLTVGLAGVQSALDGEIINRDTTVNRDFSRLLPEARFNYTMSNSKRLRVTYRTSLNEPSIEQLQPVVDNSNPLRIYQGNPDLSAEYTHNLSARLISFSQFSFSSLFVRLNATYTQDKITNAVTITDNLVQISQPINTDEEISVNLFSGYSRPIRPLGIEFSIRPSVRYTRGILFVNAIENTSDRFVTSGNFRIGNRKKDKIDLTVGVRLSHNLSMYSEDASLNQEFLTSNYYTDLTVTLFKDWRATTSFDYTVYSGESFAGTEAIPIWKGEISKLFLKNNRGQFKLTVFDLLDQNQGFVRNSTLNYIEEERSNAVGRYAMVSFTYSLSEIGAKKSGGWWNKMGGGRR